MFGKLFTSNSTASRIPEEVQRRITQASIGSATKQGTAYITSGGGSGAVLSSGTPSWAYHEGSYERTQYERMIYMRLQAGKGGVNPVAGIFDFLAVHKLNDEKMAVFVCNNGDYAVIEDDANMFPSDALITQLRMVQK